MNLYQIEEEILACVDMETGEIFDEDLFEQLTMSRDAKVENICLWIKNLNAEAAALKAEKKAFEDRLKSVERKAESLKNYISGYLDGTPFKSTRVQVGWRKSEALEIAEGAYIPDEFLRYKEPEVNKAELKNALKGGLALAGVEIVERSNIQIK